MTKEGKGFPSSENKDEEGVLVYQTENGEGFFHLTETNPGPSFPQKRDSRVIEFRKRNPFFQDSFTLSEARTLGRRRLVVDVRPRGLNSEEVRGRDTDQKGY